MILIVSYTIVKMIFNKSNILCIFFFKNQSCKQNEQVTLSSTSPMIGCVDNPNILNFTVSLYMLLDNLKIHHFTSLQFHYIRSNILWICEIQTTQRFQGISIFKTLTGSLMLYLITYHTNIWSKISIWSKI